MSTARTYAVAICGCGPAGLAAALFLRRAGHDVQLFDQLEEPRPIGSGLVLQPTGLAVLAALGLEQPVRGLGAPLRRIFGALTPGGRVVLDVAYDVANQGSHGLGVHRGALFHLLHAAVQAEGLAIQTHCRLQRWELRGTRGYLTDHVGRQFGPFDLIVDAMGAHSPFDRSTDDAGADALPYGALWATLAWPGEPFRYDQLEQRYWKSSKMAGILPIGKLVPSGPDHAAFFWSLRADAYGAWQALGLGRWKEEALAFWPALGAVLDQIADPGQLIFARYSHRTLRNPVSPGLVRIGDAAHCTSPQLGQGANMALIDAAALSAALVRCPDLQTALSRYAALRRWHVRFYQAVSRLFTPLYQSSSAIPPVLRDCLLWPLSRIPPAPRLLSALVRGDVLDPLAGFDRVASEG